MRIFTLLWFLLLAYVVAALLWWGLSLHRQSELIYQKDIELLQRDRPKLQREGHYEAESLRLEDLRMRRRSQYIGEGVTFLLIIMVGAAVVYTSFRRRLRLTRLQSNFMMAVTHELKSPLAAVKLNLETMQRRELERSQQLRLLQTSIAESDRLNELCNKILMSSQVESAGYRIVREVMDLSEFADELAAHYQSNYGQRIRTDIQAGIQARADRLLLELAINNLIENALKYSPPQSPITLCLRQKKGAACFTIADLGTGIPEDQRTQVFQKFYRIGNETTRSAKGTGLGLYLVAQVARLHKGQVRITANQPQGACIEISIPATC